MGDVVAGFDFGSKLFVKPVCEVYLTQVLSEEIGLESDSIFIAEQKCLSQVFTQRRCQDILGCVCIVLCTCLLR